MIVQCALLKCYTILGYSTETALLIFHFLQTNITVLTENLKVHYQNNLQTSLKVIGNDTVRYSTLDLQLAFHSNYIPSRFA